MASCLAKLLPPVAKFSRGLTGSYLEAKLSTQQCLVDHLSISKYHRLRRPFKADALGILGPSLRCTQNPHSEHYISCEGRNTGVLRVARIPSWEPIFDPVFKSLGRISVFVFVDWPVDQYGQVQMQHVAPSAEVRKCKRNQGRPWLQHLFHEP